MIDRKQSQPKVGCDSYQGIALAMPYLLQIRSRLQAPHNSRSFKKSAPEGGSDYRELRHA
jgi:hypothetical protein